MKKIVVLSMIISSLVFAESEFSFSKTFERKIKPDTLSSQININVSTFKEDETIETLTKFSEFMDKQKHLKVEGGGYSLFPSRQDNEVRDSYIGNINYTVSSKEPKELNKFIREIQRFDKSKHSSISISGISWQLSEAQKTGKNDELRLEAFKWGNFYSKELSLKISKSCSLKKVDVPFANYNYYNNYRTVTTSYSLPSAHSAPTPINEVQSLSINPSFTMVCK